MHSNESRNMDYVLKLISNLFSTSALLPLCLLSVMSERPRQPEHNRDERRVYLLHPEHSSLFTAFTLSNQLYRYCYFFPANSWRLRNMQLFFRVNTSTTNYITLLSIRACGKNQNVYVMQPRMPFSSNTTAVFFGSHILE